MEKFNSVILMVVVIVLLVTGCGQSPEEIASTVESEVALHVQATIESLPSATPVDTLTPIASSTPQATYTPYPTFTPMPTFTLLPTYTPFPTLEPTPEDTPTAVPTATSAPVIQPTSPPAPTTSNLETMKTALANMLSGMDNYRSTFNRRGTELFEGFQPVICQDNISGRDYIVSNIITLDVSNDIPEVQNAYAVYRDIAQRFTDVTNPWNEGCLASLSAGESEKAVDRLQRADISNKIDEFKSLLNNVNNALLTIEE